MLAVIILPALLALALGDPLPPERKHTEIIHLPAPKPQLKKVPALQEHPSLIVQHVPIKQTVVKTIDVPRDIIREVPVIVEKKLILRQPHIRKFPIDVKKVLLQPHIKHVPQVRVNYRKRPYDVWHTKEVKKFIDVPRPVPVIKHKIITKVLNRIVDVPHKVYKDKVKVVQVPQPFKVQKVHHRKIDVPIEVRVPVPRVHIKQTQEVQKVPIDVTVVKKVAIPKRTTLTEIVPVPVKPEGCGPDGVNCGSLASVNSVARPGVGLARVVERQDVVVDGAPGGVVSDTLVGGAAPVGVVSDTLVGGAAPGPLVTESVGFREGPIVDVGVGSIGSEFGAGIGPGFSSDLGPGFGGEFYPNGPRFGDGLDATFVESSLAGGSSIGLSDLGPPLGGEFGYVEGAGVGGRRSDLVSIRHTERVVPVPLTGGVSSQGGFGRLGDGYVDGPYPGNYPGDYPGGYPGGYLDGPGYLEGEFGSAALVGGGGSGFDRGSGFNTEFSGSGFDGTLGGRFETVSGGGGGGGGGSNAGVFYQETRNALPLQVTGTVRGEYVPTAEGINRVMGIRKDLFSRPSRLSAFPSGL